MAVITPSPQTAKSGVVLYLWETFTENDTVDAIELPGTGPAISSIQVVGTFGGATITLQGSNDGTTWVDLKDVFGEAISFTAAGGAEFSSSYRYIRPDDPTAGSSRDVDIYICTRG